MGCQDNVVKGLVADDIFKTPRAGDSLVHGTECYERSVLPQKNMRNSLKDLAQQNFSEESLKEAIKTIGTEKDNHSTLLYYISLSLGC